MGAKVVKNRVAMDIIEDLQEIAADSWAVELAALKKLMDYEIKAKDGESWLKQAGQKDLAISRKITMLVALARMYSGHLHQNGVNAMEEKVSDEVLLKRIADAGDAPSLDILRAELRKTSKKAGDDE